MSDLLPDWLPQQRWFGAKGRQIESIDIVSDRVVIDGDPTMRHLLVAVDLGEDVETYQLLVGRRTELPERLQHSVIGREGDLALYDATHDSELSHILLQLMNVDAVEDGLAFHRLPGTELNVELAGLVMSAEQSNTSVVFGEDYILKLFRKVAPGINPDLEITRALAATGCTAIAPPLGWIETPWGNE